MADLDEMVVQTDASGQVTHLNGTEWPRGTMRVVLVAPNMELPSASTPDRVLIGAYEYARLVSGKPR